jgi:lipopolysaccharide/colanic/teichoic acid biosynthesis glycosyltransferase
MRFRSPSSRGYFRLHFSSFDVFWAAVSPLLALYFRDAYILTPKLAEIAAVYCVLSLAGSLIAFLVFRLSDGVNRHFSVHDALNVVKAAVGSGLLSSVVLFTFTRLEGIPRSTPVLQVLILAAGLLTARTIMMLLAEDDEPSVLPGDLSAAEHIIMIGSTRLSSLYIRFLQSYRADRYRFIAILDHANKLIGRTICGVPVVAHPEHLDSVIEEFAVHGVGTDRVIIGGDEDLLPEEALDDVRRICERRGIALDFVPRLVGLQPAAAPQSEVVSPSIQPQGPAASMPAYYTAKRLIDFFVALAAIIVFSPILLMSALLVLWDVGSPVLFWQQRIGRNGRSFLVYKFRTLQPPFNGLGQAIPTVRLSAIGYILRRSRLDELPQLFSVLVGDMSLIGPRPLLPHDQPTNANDRLSVRPGITGWAQVHGGNLITREEKGALDQWYIRHLSLWLDLRIALLTLRFLFTGERRFEDAIRAATSSQDAASQSRRRLNIREDGDDSQAVAVRAVGVIRTSEARTRRAN